MGNVQPIRKEELGEVVDFGTKKKEIKGEEVKLRKDGKPKQTPCNSVKGDPHEVYPIKDKADIEKMKQYFRDKIESVYYPEDKQIWGRNLMLFCVGLNLGLRCSDIVSLTWGDIFDNNGEFFDGIRRSEKKTGKFKTFFLNQACKDAITEYINQFNPLIEPQLHIFRSREGGHIGVRTVGNIIKQAGIDCDIKVPLGSHSLRKTFGHFFYINHMEDIRALTQLQRLFAHSSQSVTLAYIGITDDETREFYNDLNL